MAYLGKIERIWLVGPICAALFTYILTQTGWLSSLNGFLYDTALKFAASLSDQTSTVVFIRVNDPQQLSDKEAIQILDTLTGANARVVAFNFVPTQCSRDFFEYAAQLQCVVFGRLAIPVPEDPDRFELAPWPAQATGLNLHWGAVYLAPPEAGVYRKQFTVLNINGTNALTLEAKAALLSMRNVFNSSLPPSFLVNFKIYGQIPNLDITRVIQKDLLPSLVKDKIVLIGMDPTLKSIETPLARNKNAMSLVEFQAYALHTLASYSIIGELKGILLFIAIVGITFATSLTSTHIGGWTILRTTFLLIVSTLLTSLALLAYANYWLPSGSLCLAILIQSTLELAHKNRLAQLAINELRLRTISAIEDRVGVQKNVSTNVWWDRLASFLKENFNLKRFVVLERNGETQKLTPTKFYNFRDDSLAPEYLDLGSQVYKQAIANQSPTLAHKILGPAQEMETDFICPLIYDGKLIGIWIVRLEKVLHVPTRKLEPLLLRLSYEIARTIYTNKAEKQRPKFGVRLTNWLASETNNPVYSELVRATESLAQYYEILEIVYEQISIPTFVFDFWGRLVKINAPAKQLLMQANFPTERFTAFELLTWLLDQNANEARTVLQNVLIEHSSVSRPLTLPSQEDRQFLLRVYPLVNPRETHLKYAHANIRGIICELIETTSLATLASLKGIVADRLGVDLRNHLSAIKLAAGLLESDSTQPLERTALLETIQQKVDTCVQILRECQKYLSPRVDTSSMKLFPVDALTTLELVCTRLIPKAAESGINFKIDAPQVMVQVLANPVDLTTTFDGILRLLIADAAENSEICIQIRDEGATVTFAFSNSGSGMPEEFLRDILTSPDDPTSEEFRLLRNATIWVRDWGGAIDIKSTVGKGYLITLKLRLFQTISKQA